MVQRRPLILLFATCVAAAFSVIAPLPAEGHDGNSPHVPDAWFADRAALVFDKDSDVGDQWQFNATVQHYNDNTFQIFNVPDIRVGECENTQSPCYNVHKTNQPGESYVKFDGNPIPPGNGDIWLNLGQAPADRSASCWVIGRILGEHEFTGAPNSSCLSKPTINPSHDFPQQAVLDEINGAYAERRGEQL